MTLVPTMRLSLPGNPIAKMHQVKRQNNKDGSTPPMMPRSAILLAQYVKRTLSPLGLKKRKIGYGEMLLKLGIAYTTPVAMQRSPKMAVQVQVLIYRGAEPVLLILFSANERQR